MARVASPAVARPRSALSAAPARVRPEAMTVPARRPRIWRRWASGREIMELPPVWRHECIVLPARQTKNGHKRNYIFRFVALCDVQFEAQSRRGFADVV